MTSSTQGSSAHDPAGGRLRFGVSAALTTPFDEAPSSGIDTARMAAHARAVLAAGARSVTLFGTTGEGASIDQDERETAHQALLDAGIPPDAIMVGLAGTALGAVARQAEAAIARGCRTLLIPPPFYFRGPDEDGVVGWYRALFARMPTDRVEVILYHIPQVTGVPLSPAQVRRLRETFPDLIVGVKDSSGVWDTAQAFLAEPGLAVLVGDERLLAAAARLGAAGTISGLANLCPDRLNRMLETGQDDPGIHTLVDAVVQMPVTPAVKALVAHLRRDSAWARVRVPLVPTPAATADTLTALYDRLLAREPA